MPITLLAALPFLAYSRATYSLAALRISSLPRALLYRYRYGLSLAVRAP